MVRLTSDEDIAGEATSVSDQKIVVKSFENYGMERHVIANTTAIVIGAAVLDVAIFAYSLRDRGK